MYQDNVNALLSAWNSGDLEGLNAHVSNHVVRKSPTSLNSDAYNLPELKEVISKFRTAFPDCHVRLDEIHFTENRSFARWTFTGTNTGDGDFPPTGKAIDISGSSFSRFEDGKMTEELVYMDALEFMTQLGLIELPAVV